MGLINELFFGKYDALSRALKRSGAVKVLHIQLSENLDDNGIDFGHFTRLRSLSIQGNNDRKPDFLREIGSLERLKKLSLLNVPLDEFPGWILELTNLDYLMIRGCEMLSIPLEIINLRKLNTLRIENCELKSLPPELKEMNSLKYLSLSDTKINFIDTHFLPPNLEVLNIMMTHIDANELKRIKQNKPILKFDRID